MIHALRTTLLVLTAGLVFVSSALAQQAVPQQPLQPAQQQPLQQQQPPAVQPQPPQPPAGFELNQLQLAYLDQVLNAWQKESDKINTFRCEFERFEYNAAFGPSPDIPLNKDKGDISFSKPDKGSFQITEIKTWQAKPIPPGQTPPAQTEGDWVVQPNAVGEHWVCDGENIYEYRHDQKQLVQRPLPENMKGKAIADGPLPFLFGADANKLKQRYWMRVDQQPNAEEIWVVALPRFQEQAANFKAVEVILDRKVLLPKAMQVYLPDGSRHVYMFDVAHANVNGPLDKIRSLFQLQLPSLGWKVVKEDMPIQQASQPAQQQPR